MPELPEVQQVVTYLKKLEGKQIKEVSILSPLILRVPSEQKKIIAQIKNLKIQSVNRKAKYILVELSNRGLLIFHLGMTGQLFWQERGAFSFDKHTHAALQLSGNKILCFRDYRRFGFVDYLPISDEETLKNYFRNTGPDPFEIEADEFLALLQGRNGVIKSLLLNQKLVSGLGNIYADESLHAAGIRPTRRAASISRQRKEILFEKIRKILKQAIAKGGSSINSYVLPDGTQGAFQNEHQVYGRKDQPCYQCGHLIKKIVLAGRGTSYCPACQS